MIGIPPNPESKSYTALTIASLAVPHLSGPDEYDADKRAIAANFPLNLCVPLYPSITMDKVSVEECFEPLAKPFPVPNTARFTVSLPNLSARSIVMHYTTVDGSAQAGTDYTNVSGILLHPQFIAEGDH